MKRIVLSLAIVAGLTFSATSCKKSVEATEAETVAETSVEAVTYAVDTDNSVIEWKGGKVLGGSHNGTIALSSGEVSVRDGEVEAGSFTLDMDSIVVLDIEDEEKRGWLEGHLKGATDENRDDFFNVMNFPDGKFEITDVANGEIKGNLTLKGVTKNIAFPATVTVTDLAVTIESDTFNIDRTQWNINFANESMTDLAKDNVISNNIEIKLAVKALK